MNLFLTGVIAFLTVILCWQAFFQNNVVLFQKRMELYQEYARKYHVFVDYADELHKNVLFVIAKSTGSDDNEAAVKPKMLTLIQNLSDLEGARDPILFIGFSDQVNNIIKQAKDNASLITDFLTQTQKRKSEVSRKDVDDALSSLKNLTKADSELNLLFQSELPLRNLEFYWKKYVHVVKKAKVQTLIP
ncbi:MAG: hypothetical protein JJT82_01215 [Legionellaceae bacterium]|nr:hypothetical protein [Legionellaceae bacterium]